MQFHRLPGFPNLGTPQGGSFLGRQISPNLEKATRDTAAHHPGPQTSPRCPPIPSCTFQPCVSGGGSLNWWLLLSSGPNTRRKSISRVTSQPLPRWRHQDRQDPGRPYSTLEMLPRNLTVFQLQGHLPPHFPNSPKPRPIIVIVVSPNLPGHLPALFWELGQLRQRLLSSPAIQNLESFPLTLLYSKSSRLPSSP